ncbi:hypothetical protein [Streptomyces sp. AK010]|uniref:hypothetical protein n=1 Tax=Streptomyces sp. AK010 TaxID=2723074 RepID=UPI001620174E|nr:hypothetical protein [Streptomyces sp. AK010]MBB6421936.1 hypothetical protein [Streptomyces sp. AK010]
MTSDRWRLAENVTLSVCAWGRLVLTVNPWFGTAEIRQTASSPNRTVTLPPSDGTVWTPTPPSWHPESSTPVGAGVLVRPVGMGRRVGLGSVAAWLLRGGEPGLRLLADGLGEGFAVVGLDRGGFRGLLGADCATGAVGRVDPTTK